jgi:mRNA-degrading endonuclease RelE of RelBE toxin-antitoxin system
MRYRVEVSDEAEKQLSQFPRKAQERMKRAIDELEEKDDFPLIILLSRCCRAT